MIEVAWNLIACVAAFAASVAHFKENRDVSLVFMGIAFAMFAQGVGRAIGHAITEMLDKPKGGR